MYFLLLAHRNGVLSTSLGNNISFLVRSTDQLNIPLATFPEIDLKFVQCLWGNEVLKLEH
jgi:hypothetical protein